MNVPPSSPDRIRELAQIGLMAARRCDLATAEAIFSALELTHPDRAVPYLGLGLARFAVGSLPDALAALDRGLRVASASEHPPLHTLRGAVLLAAGRRAEGEAALRRAGEVPLARAVLEGPAIASWAVA